jgi:UDP-N-acetylglucosamine acyltransferase
MTEPKIHPTAVVSESATLGSGVTVGPYAVIEDHVEIGADCSIAAHAVIHDFVRMGTGNRIHAHAVLGDVPQDYAFKGEESWVELGDRNIIREGVTIHRPTSAGKPTRVGSECFLMAYSHIAHDCTVGDGVIITNNSCLGGHVEVGDRAVLGGGVMVHQHFRIGPLAMLAGLCGVNKDILPYSMVHGRPALHYGLNKVGLRRAGVTKEGYAALEEAFRALRAGKPLPESLKSPEVDLLREWLGNRSKRSYARFVREAG